MGDQESPVFSRPTLTLDEEAQKAFSGQPDEVRKFLLSVIHNGDLAKAFAEAGMAPVQYAGSKTLPQAIEDAGITSDVVAEALKRCLNGKVTRFDRHQEPYEVTDKYLILKTVELIAKLQGALVNIHKRDNSDKKGVMDLFPDEPG